MNIDKAIAIIDDAIGQLKLTRTEHYNLQVAMDLVKVMRQEFKRLKEAELKDAESKKPGTPEEKKPIDNEQGTPVE